MIPELFQMSLRHLATTIFDADKLKPNKNDAATVMKRGWLLFIVWFRNIQTYLVVKVPWLVAVGGMLTSAKNQN